MILRGLILGMLLVGSAFAAEPVVPPSPTLTPAGDTAGPLQLNAAQQLQWKPDDQALEASGNVHLTYKGFVLQAHRARLLYRDTPSSVPPTTTAPAMDQIRALDLQGDVVFNNAPYTITCQRAQYQFSDQRLHLTGDPVVVKNDTDTAKIWGTLTMDLAQSRMDGVGPVHLSRQSYDIKGNDLTLMFLPWDINQLQNATLNTASLLRDVVLIHPQLNVTANHGLYDAAGQTITLTSNVTITRQNSVIRTEQAVLDLTTRRVRLKSPNQPVTGTLHVPDFEKDKTQPKDTP
ncbi:MAG: LptA/OstA family protein [Alphaproteobacteria bacterium]